MERKDFRSIGRDAQEALRERAVYLVLHEGKTQAEAAGLVGVHRQVVNRWIGRHRDEGAAGWTPDFPAQRQRNPDGFGGTARATLDPR